MPPFIALVIAGVGLYAGVKWLSGEVQRAAAEHAAKATDGGGDAAHSAGRAPGAEARHMPRDLGTLEWDAAAGVYRPRKETAG